MVEVVKHGDHQRDDNMLPPLQPSHEHDERDETAVNHVDLRQQFLEGEEVNLSNTDAGVGTDDEEEEEDAHRS